MDRYADNPLLVATTPPSDAQILEHFRYEMSVHQLVTGGKSIGMAERLHARFVELLTEERELRKVKSTTTP